MIIPNGTLQFAQKTGGGLNPDGYPTPPTYAFTAPIPCQYIPHGQDLTATAGNQHTERITYEVLLQAPLPCFDTETVRLHSDSGRDLGIHPVKAFEELRAVQQVRITL